MDHNYGFRIVYFIGVRYSDYCDTHCYRAKAVDLDPIRSRHLHNGCCRSTRSRGACGPLSSNFFEPYHCWAYAQDFSSYNYKISHSSSS